MKIAYQLRDDTDRIIQVQKATRTTEDFGIEPTQGLFGSTEWWDAIAKGELPLYTTTGIITDRFMGSMGDWPMIKVRSDEGEHSQWTREMNDREQDALYRPGCRIEIDYVLLRHRKGSSAPDADHMVVVEVRIEPKAEGDKPGSYEKLRAKEIAQAVLTQPFWTVPEVTPELAKLGSMPGVIPDELHKLFLNVCADIDRRLDEIPKGQPEHQQIERVLTEIHERWKDVVFAACKDISGEHS